ncbi:hypothetical protein KAI46_08160 [bacterium]|nr:hypothetical protein [bacterium]
MGKQLGIGVPLDSVLGLFGEKLVPARRAYHKFIVDGLEAGKLPDLSGGGLRRSQGNNASAEKSLDFDDRILGSSEFVASLRQEGLLEPNQTVKMTLIELQKLIEVCYRLTDQGLLNRGRQNRVAKARNLFCYCGVKMLRSSGAEVGRYLNIGSSSVTRSFHKGEQLVNENVKLRSWIEQGIKQ